MNQTFENYLSQVSIELNIYTFIINLLLTIFLSLLFAFCYRRFGISTSNRDLFSKNFVLVATTTMIIITIVKSSIALSLGLVGALSIVRFRAAIKEPEELTFLFICIAIGVGLGAGQRNIIIIGSIIMLIFIFLRNYFYKSEDNESNLYISMNYNNNLNISLDQVKKLLSNYTSEVKLIRYDQIDESIEIIFYVNFDNLNAISNFREDLKELGKINLSIFEKNL